MIDYANGPGYYEHKVHPPVNFHAFAACTKGIFTDSTESVKGGRFAHCLVLLRGKMQPSLDAILKLKAEGLTVWTAWKECGQAQIADQLADPKTVELYGKALSACDGFISPTLVPPPLPPNVESLPIFSLPTPYPVEFPNWNYEEPFEDRQGVFLGTREFFTTTRNHLTALSAALRVAKRVGTHVTVINREKGKGKKLLTTISEQAGAEHLRVIEGTMSYDSYLMQIAKHKVVFQLDRSAVPGQVAGDALLVRLPCIGGNSAIERLVFPNESHPTLSEADAEIHLERLLTDDEALRASVTASQEKASRMVSYEVIAAKLAELMG